MIGHRARMTFGAESAWGRALAAEPIALSSHRVGTLAIFFGTKPDLIPSILFPQLRRVLYSPPQYILVSGIVEVSDVGSFSF